MRPSHWGTPVIERGLNEALQTRKIIGEAIGILMERHAVNEDRAFAFLVRASSHANIKLRVVAQELVDERNNAQAGVQIHSVSGTRR